AGFFHHGRRAAGQGDLPARGRRRGPVRAGRHSRGAGGAGERVGTRCAPRGGRLMQYEASAPGKAVLAGEYAVLHGAPAISMALDCRAIAGVQAAGGEWHGVRAPGGNAVRFRLRPDGGLEWERAEERGAWSLLEEVARQ